MNVMRLDLAIIDAIHVLPKNERHAFADAIIGRANAWRSPWEGRGGGPVPWPMVVRVT